ncbi:glycosyltransferase [Blastococcus montanus]|uniref:glycosyltransferase n=1 Tax=Blastococcus montanus TaxID=3144973 RepID=UPI003208FFD1
MRNRAGDRRPAVSVVTWQRHAGRAEEMAAALGGEAVHVYYPGLTSGVARNLGRYALSALATAAHLVVRRPRAVLVTNPPVVPGLISTVYGQLTGRPVVLDSHPTSFGAKDHAMSQRLLPVHRAMARRAAAVMVTTEHWVRVVEGWGARGIVVHEAPPAWTVSSRPDPGGRRPRVLFVGVFGSDEPVDVVMDAARRLPDVEVHVTGDPARCPAPLQASLPSNVVLTGFLGPADYRRAVEEADVLLVLTTEPTSVVRAGYEAVYARRALVVSDTPVLREVFPAAVHTSNTADAVADALRRALSTAGDPEPLDRAHATQQARWQSQLAALRQAIARGPRRGVGGDANEGRSARPAG